MKKKIGFLIGAAALYFFFRRKTSTVNNVNTDNNANTNNSASMLVTDPIIKNALFKIYEEFGREKTEMLERLFRWETSHFRSRQFKGGYSPGMEPSPNNNKIFPFGWTSLKNFAQTFNIPTTKFYITGPYTEGGTGRQKFFVGFPDLYTSMAYVMYVIGRRNWNFGKWRAFDETISNDYNNKLKTVMPRITNTFL